MTPQSAFTVVAAVADGREGALRLLLDGMNLKTGMADPRNALLPFGEFERLHFARFALLDDSTLADLEAFNLPRPHVPLLYLAFVGECDGPAEEQLAEFASRAGPGLGKIFGHCVGFDAGTDLLAWMKEHDLPIGANYINRVGRTVRQVHEEAALQRKLSAQAPRAAVGAAALDPQVIRRQLLEFVEQERKAGHLTLTPPAPTPTDWKVRKLINLIGTLLVLVVFSPLWIVFAILGAVQLRRAEKSDPEFCPRLDAKAVLAMQRLEDRDLSNSFTALGPVKPGWFRRALVVVVLMAIDFACRHVFYKGHLARIQSIHFARWVFMDNKTRVLFCSNYDGSHESYMDDFVNKAAWGLNLVFSHGFGWPRTDWLILGGARREQLFKRYQRRHQLPTQVWYKAYPGLTLSDLERNRRIREGVEASTMSDEEALEWLRLI